MKKAFRRGFLLGIGLARLTAKKMSDEVHKFARENNLNKREAEQMAKEFVASAGKERKRAVSLLKKEGAMVQKKFKSARSTIAHKFKKK